MENTLERIANCRLKTKKDKRAASLDTCADGEDPNLLRLFQFAQTIVPFALMLNQDCSAVHDY